MKAPRVTKRPKTRSAARLAAVQALYQLGMEDISEARLLREFHDHRLGAEIEDVQYAEADVDFFDDLVMGVNARRDEINDIIEANLNEKWRFDRLDITMRQILRAGVYELIARPDVPTSTVINEYLDVAHAFVDEREAKFVSALLDAVAKEKRG